MSKIPLSSTSQSREASPWPRYRTSPPRPTEATKRSNSSTSRASFQPHPILSSHARMTAAARPRALTTSQTLELVSRGTIVLDTRPVLVVTDRIAISARQVEAARL
jgi:hypothetical protein